MKFTKNFQKKKKQNNEATNNRQGKDPRKLADTTKLQELMVGNEHSGDSNHQSNANMMRKSISEREESSCVLGLLPGYRTNIIWNMRSGSVKKRLSNFDPQ